MGFQREGVRENDKCKSGDGGGGGFTFICDVVHVTMSFRLNLKFFLKNRHNDSTMSIEGDSL
jgi:hypothetical protein